MQSPRYSITERHKLPESPGVYQFYNKKGRLIYVGKAKNVKKRVSSYFTKQWAHFLKTCKMVKQVVEVAVVLVNSEYEALILENNLIKAHQPRYNVLLKDDKTYPYLCLTKGPFPRLIATRQRSSKLGQYFGPFTSMRMLEQIQELVQELYPLRSCKYLLSEKNIKAKKFKVCLEYHIGRCLGPCEGLQEEASYNNNIKDVVLLLKGNFQAIKRSLKRTMLQAADTRDFKRAQKYKSKLEAVERYQKRSLITNPALGSFDVVAIVSQEKHAFVSYLYIKGGVMVFVETLSIERKLEESEADMLSMALLHFREQSGSEAKSVLSSGDIATCADDLEVVIPKVGDKRKLVELAIKNAFFYQKEYLNSKVKRESANRSTLVLLQEALGLSILPNHIECFDNSNLQGTHPVAGMVCFKGGRPAKRDYRKFHIKTVVGPDDFASMEEIVRRRYGHLVKEGASLPDLIVIDGGKGQLSAALKALKEVGIDNRVAIIGIAKKLEAIYRPGDPDPLYISKKSPALKLLQRIRNATHDFAIGFHRGERSRASLESELEGVAGVGPKTIAKLLKQFGSLASIRDASLEKLQACVGEAKASLLWSYFGHDAPGQ